MMIRNLWYGILDSKQVKSGKPIGVTRMGEKLVLWRSEDGSVSCIADQCCHRGASLALGTCANGHLACPFHGFRYDKSGRVILIPANGKASPVPERYQVTSWKVEDRYGFIWLWYGDPNEPNLPEIPFFEDLRSGFSYGGFSETWAVHYTRAVENQLDVVHLPFVHTDSIGRGNHTLVNGPVVEWEKDRMTFYVNNVVDDGHTTPKKPHEMENYRDLFHLQLQMPNLWQNIIGEKVRIVAVFAPIDASHTHIYLRFYQSFLTLPVLRNIISLLSQPMNRRILHQDRKVVLSQLPDKTALKMGENLIQGDAPIIEFRKRRAMLKGEL